MAFTNTILAVCLYAIVVEGHYFPNYGFGFGPMSFMKPLPIPQPPRLPGPFQPPPLPEPPLLPIPFGFGPIFDRHDRYAGPNLEIIEPRPLRFPSPFDFPRDNDRGSGFSGFTVSSTSNGGGGGVTVLSTNHNGETQTFVSPSASGLSDLQYVRVPPRRLGSPVTGFARIMQATRNMFMHLTNFIKQGYGRPEPRLPEFGPPAIEFYY